MQQYWNFIAIPYFFIVMIFGIYVLFSLSSIQLADSTLLSTLSTQLKKDAKGLQAIKFRNMSGGPPKVAAA